MNYWLVKSDPEEYGWPQFLKDKTTDWTGVRAYPARIHLRNMVKNDIILFYHSGDVSAIVGIAWVAKEFFHDPTTEEEAWVAVGLEAIKAFVNTVPLE